MPIMARKNKAIGVISLFLLSECNALASGAPSCYWHQYQYKDKKIRLIKDCGFRDGVRVKEDYERKK